MVSTTRPRVNFFLNKFRKMGLIDYEGERPITINDSLLSVVLRELNSFANPTLLRVDRKTVRRAFYTPACLVLTSLVPWMPSILALP
jgi:hypothetical protein